MTTNLIKRMIRNHRRRAGINETNDIKNKVYEALHDDWVIREVNSYRQQTSYISVEGYGCGDVDTLYGVVSYIKFDYNQNTDTTYYKFNITVDRVSYSVTHEESTGNMSDRALIKLAAEFARLCFHEAVKKYVQAPD